MVIDSVDTLIAVLDEARLLDAPQRAELAGSLRHQSADPRALARALVERGWLTPYHINQVFQGHGRDLILGPYLILERIGAGGMGQVFKARHLKLGRIVALKIIRKEYLANPDAVRRFHREIQAVAQLSHPNVVLALDAEENGDTHYIVMEYVDGVDLAKLLKESGPLAVAQACDYARQAALGLQQAHERGLVHRDVKPSNLLITQMPNRPGSGSRKSGLGSAAPWGVVKVLDLGMARTRREAANAEHTATLTHAGVMVGTPDYTAPEQALDAHGVDIRADVYSLGCTLYQMLTGKVPFPGGTGMEKLFKHQLETPQPVEELRAGLPPGLGDVLRCLMARDPAHRPQTPAEAARALEPFAGTAPSAPFVLPPVRPASAEAPTEAIQSALITTPPQSPPRRTVQPAPARTAAAPLPPSTPPKAAPAPNLRRRSRWPLVVGFAGVGVVVLCLVVGSFLLGRKNPGPGSQVQATTKEVDHRPPLDQLDHANILAADRPPGLPPEVVGVVGSQQMRAWTGNSFSSRYSPVVSPDGRLALISGAAVTPVWRIASGEALPHLVRLAYGTNAAFSIDGKTLYVTGYQALRGQTVRAIDVASGAERVLLNQPASRHQPYHVAPTGDVVLVSDGKTNTVWDLLTNQERCTLAGAQTMGTPYFSADGQFVAIVSYARAELPLPLPPREPVPIPAKDVLRELPADRSGAGKKVEAHLDEPVKVKADLQPAPNPVPLFRSEISLYDLRTGKRIDSFAAEAPVWVGVAAGGRSLVWATRVLTEGLNNYHLHSRDTQDPRGNRARPVLIRAEASFAAALSPDGATLACGVAQQLKLLDPATGEERRSTSLRCSGLSASFGLAFTPDGKTLLATAGDPLLHRFDVASGREIGTVAEFNFLQDPSGVTPDGRSVFACVRSTEGQTLCSWELPSLSLKKSIKLTGPGGVAVGLARGGRAILVHEQNGALSLIDLETGTPTKVGTAVAPVVPGLTNLVISADGTVAAQIGPGGSVWDLVGQKPPVPLENVTAQTMRGCLSMDGRVVAAWDVAAKAPRVWDATTGKDRRLAIKLTEPFTSTFAISPDGKSIAAVSMAVIVPQIRYKLQVWDAATGQPRAAKESIPETVTNLRFLPDGKLLLGYNQIGLVVWDPVGGKEQALKGSPNPWGKWEPSADGKFLATCDSQGQFSVWNLLDGSPLSLTTMPGVVVSTSFAPDGRHLTTINGNGTMYIVRLPVPH